MTATIELNCARRKLQSALGDGGACQYFGHLKCWFRKQKSKEEFDIEARKLLSVDTVHLHNEFLLAILNKCQTLANFTPVQPKALLSTAELLSPSKYDPNLSVGGGGGGGGSNNSLNGNNGIISNTAAAATTIRNPGSGESRLKRGKINSHKKSGKCWNTRHDHRFQPVSISNVVVDVDAYDLHEEEKSLRYCYKSSDGSLPDVSLIHGRMLVSAWEEGLEGVEDGAVQMALAAVEHQLRQLITAMIISRNGYKLRDGVPVQIGSVVPDPWLLNSQRRLRPLNGRSEIIEPTRAHEDDKDMSLIPVGRSLLTQHHRGPSSNLEDPLSSLIPVGRPLLTHSQHRAMMEVACGSSSVQDLNSNLERKPLSLFDLMETMQRNKNIIPSHTVYSLNIERIISRLYHKGHHD